MDCLSSAWRIPASQPPVFVHPTPSFTHRPAALLAIPVALARQASSASAQQGKTLAHSLLCAAADPHLFAHDAGSRRRPAAVRCGGQRQRGGGGLRVGRGDAFLGGCPNSVLLFGFSAVLHERSCRRPVGIHVCRSLTRLPPGALHNKTPSRGGFPFGTFLHLGNACMLGNLCPTVGTGRWRRAIAATAACRLLLTAHPLPAPPPPPSIPPALSRRALFA